MLRLALRTLLLICCSTFSLVVHSAIEETVSTHSGHLLGSHEGELTVFRGVPYAAPPVGANRWREPLPAPAWSGIRSAKEFAPRCIQRGYSPDTADQALTSEDCLYLNIWSPAEQSDANLPVMIWIHGGGFFVGSGSGANYDGANLATKGAVVITINYRLGSFGFLAHPQLSAESPNRSSGNYAILDMIAATQWVQDNIEAFGGNPDNITIMGESAGGNAVSTLIASPLAEGLFQRAILQSGGWLGWLQVATVPQPTLAEREALGKAQTDALNIRSLAALRQLSAEDVLNNFPGDGAINHDGFVLPDDISVLLGTGQFNHVDILSGSNQNEAVFFGPGIQSAEEFKDFAVQRFGEHSDDYLSIYPADNDSQANASYLQSHTNQLAWQMRKMAQLQAANNKQAWLYFFSRVAPGQEARGATHVAELPYMFNHPADGWVETDHTLSDSMSAYWVNFATTGNPNGNGLPQWPAFNNATTGPALELGNTIDRQMTLEPNTDALKLFDDNFERFIRKYSE